VEGEVVGIGGEDEIEAKEEANGCGGAKGDVRVAQGRVRLQRRREGALGCARDGGCAGGRALGEDGGAKEEGGEFQIRTPARWNMAAPD